MINSVSTKRVIQQLIRYNRISGCQMTLNAYDVAAIRNINARSSDVIKVQIVEFSGREMGMMQGRYK